MMEKLYLQSPKYIHRYCMVKRIVRLHIHWKIQFEIGCTYTVKKIFVKEFIETDFLRIDIE